MAYEGFWGALVCTGCHVWLGPGPSGCVQLLGAQGARSAHGSCGQHGCCRQCGRHRLLPLPPNGGSWVVWVVLTATSCVHWGLTTVHGHWGCKGQVAPLACVSNIGAASNVAGAGPSHCHPMGVLGLFGVGSVPPKVCHRAKCQCLATRGPCWLCGAPGLCVLGRLARPQ